MIKKFVTKNTSIAAKIKINFYKYDGELIYSDKFINLPLNLVNISQLSCSDLTNVASAHVVQLIKCTRRSGSRIHRD